MRIRYHRGGFEESMATTAEVDSFSELIEFLFPPTNPFTIRMKKLHLTSEQYEDNRNDWDNHWLLDHGQVIAITDGHINQISDAMKFKKKISL